MAPQTHLSLLQTVALLLPPLHLNYNSNAGQKNSAFQVPRRSTGNSDGRSATVNLLDLPDAERHKSIKVLPLGCSFTVGCVLVIIFCVMQLLLTMVGVNIYNRRIHFESSLWVM
jgi:hypothetical protein